MDLTKLKETVGIPQFNFNPSTDKDGKKDAQWMRHWENDTRVSVSIHRDTLAKIKANMQSNDLGIQTEKREGGKGEYTSHRIVMFTPAEQVL